MNTGNNYIANHSTSEQIPHDLNTELIRYSDTHCNVIKLTFQERWMCPNHVEHFLDSNLVSSTSVTQRLKIWQKYARTPVNPDSVRLEFFRKVRSGKLFRSARTARLVKPIEARYIFGDCRGLDINWYFVLFYVVPSVGLFF